MFGPVTPEKGLVFHDFGVMDPSRIPWTVHMYDPWSTSTVYKIKTPDSQEGTEGGGEGAECKELNLRKRCPSLLGEQAFGKGERKTAQHVSWLCGALPASKRPEPRQRTCEQYFGVSPTLARCCLDTLTKALDGDYRLFPLRPLC